MLFGLHLSVKHSEMYRTRNVRSILSLSLLFMLMYYRELDVSESLQQLVSSQQANRHDEVDVKSVFKKDLSAPHTELSLVIGLLDVNGHIHLSTLYYLEDICLRSSTFLA